MPAIPLLGDRAAWDSMSYPERHSNELPNNPVHHVPVGSAIGEMLAWDGAKWVASSGPPIMTLGTYEGDLAVSSSPFKTYNLYGTNRGIIKVFLSVSEAPTGDDIIVDVYVDGVSIFNVGDRPTILAGEGTGQSVTFVDPLWPINSYVTWDILQVGGTTPGKDLVVHIVHEPAIGGS